MTELFDDLAWRLSAPGDTLLDARTGLVLFLITLAGLVLYAVTRK